MAAHAFKRLHAGIDKPRTAREWVAKVVDHHWVEVFIMFLVACDLVIVAVEVGVDTEYLCLVGEVVPQNGLPAHGKVSVTPEVVPNATYTHVKPTATPSLGSFFEVAASPKVPSFVRGAARQKVLGLEALTLVGHPGHEPHVSARPAAEPAGGHAEQPVAEHAGGHTAGHAGGHAEVLVCETHEGHHTSHIMHVLHLCSIWILGIFMVELLLKLWANPSHFLESWCHALDLVVVTISFLLDAVILPLFDSLTLAARRQLLFMEFILVFSRLWRVVRIFHAIFEGYHHVEEVSAAKSQEENAVMRKALARFGVDPDRELQEAERKKGARDHAVY